MKTAILSAPSHKISWMIALGTVCVLSFLYIVQINILVELTYLAAEYEETVNVLGKETATLEMRSTQTFSVSALEHMARLLEFERVGEVQYIKIGGGSVVAQNAQVIQ